MVVAPIIAGREGDLRALLESMNSGAGQANPKNPLVPFGQFEQLHFARFVILTDLTLEDIHTAYGLPRVDYPVCLALIADFDGTADDLRADLVKRASAGLQQIFSFCQGFTPGVDLARWMKEHEAPAIAMYKNWRGRTVGQIREENRLRLAMEIFLQEKQKDFVSKTPRQVYQELKNFAKRETLSGRLTLTSPRPTPLDWWLRNCFHFLAGLVLAPLLFLLFIPYIPIFIYQLRRREKSDMVIAPRVTLKYELDLAAREDHDVTNQFTVMGGIKPGLFRRWTMTVILWIVDWVARHVFNRGHLARISTIHAARWVFINDKRRLVFTSNYDGSLDSYMDDFINKVGWGLNLIFSNGISYPTTNWLVLDGSKNEQKYKYVLRRHQQPTEVWYKAYPGLGVFDLKRNTLIREGLEKWHMSDAQLQQWLGLF